MSEGYGTQAPLFAQDQTAATGGPLCKRCGKPRPPRSTKFCGKGCSDAWYSDRHPRIHVPIPEPGEKRQPVKVRLVELLMDRGWWTLQALSQKLGEQAQSVSARIRELRAQGFQIDHRVAKVPWSKNAHEYRLVKP